MVHNLRNTYHKSYIHTYNDTSYTNTVDFILILLQITFTVYGNQDQKSIL